MATKTKTKTKTKTETMNDMRARHQERLKTLLTCRSCPEALGGYYYRQGSPYCAECEHQHDTAALMKHVKTYAIKGYGHRCRTFEPGCAVCRIWQCHDILELLICDEPGPHDNYRD